MGCTLPPVEITWAPGGNHVGAQGQSRGPPVEITCAPRGNHVGRQGAMTWAHGGNHVGPPWKSRGPPGAITWAPRRNHVGPQGQSRGPPAAITWAPRGNNVPGGSDGNESACNGGVVGLIPGLGRSPGDGNGNPLQYSCLENSTEEPGTLQSIGVQRVVPY